jgi:hypothetical protein
MVTLRIQGMNLWVEMCVKFNDQREMDTYHRTSREVQKIKPAFIAPN